MLRVRRDLSDLPRALRWAAAHDAEARATAAAGRARACALLHTPHVAGYVAKLLRRYAALFAPPLPPGAAGARHAPPTPAALHRAVRRLALAPPFGSPEKLLAFRLGGINGRQECSEWWLGELRCHELRALARQRKQLGSKGDPLPY